MVGKSCVFGLIMKNLSVFNYDEEKGLGGYLR